MGLTPLEGLIMGTRSGDVDPSILDFIAQKENLTVLTSYQKTSDYPHADGDVICQGISVFVMIHFPHPIETSQRSYPAIVQFANIDESGMLADFYEDSVVIIIL